MKDAVLSFLATVPAGRVITYGRIAEAVGHPGAARAVGTILHHNPDPTRYPCHRVVDARGRLSKSFAFGGLAGQRALLEREGVPVCDGAVDLGEYLMK